MVVCTNCGVVQEEDGNFRAEVEFDETSTGMAVRGTFVRADQTHQKQYHNRVSGANNAGREATSSAVSAKSIARQKMSAVMTSLGIYDVGLQSALYIFDQAYSAQFYRGRTLESVAVVSLYLAIRRNRGNAKYALMLIDFAEACQPQLNVFELGRMAKELQSRLFLTERDKISPEWIQLEHRRQSAKTDAEKAGFAEQQRKLSARIDRLTLQDPEDLIERFCDKLDFGDMTRTVINDAIKVAKSMNRDWMTTGRRPAGIAGAAVIIAARMNNFARTLREVVLVAKVTEITLGKRIEEFKETKSSKVSVQQFRAEDHESEREGSAEIMPPSIYTKQPEYIAKKASTKRKRKGKQAETAAEIENGEAAAEQENGETADAEQPAAKRPRVDAQGFAIPALPSKPGSATPQPGKRKVGKPKGAKNWAPPPPTEAELQEEEELQEDIRDQLRRNVSLDPTGSIAQSDMLREQPRSTPQPEPAPGVLSIAYPAPRPRDEIGPAADNNIGNTMRDVQQDVDIANNEFDDDPDVANCVLNDTERQIKETIWVTENAEWLRLEHSKKIKKELKEREMREKGLDPEKERMKKLRRKDGMMRAGRAGDISYLHEERNKKQKDKDAVDGDRGSQTPDGEQQPEKRIDARGAVKTMMKQRGTFSRRVDYDLLSRAYTLPGESDPSESRSESPADAAAAAASNYFYKPSSSHGAKNSSVRRARKTVDQIQKNLRGEIDEDTDAGEDRSAGSRSRSRSESQGQAASATPERRTTQADTTGQLATPAASQPVRPSPARSVVDGSESPLSSTHTPAGFSGAPNTPQATQHVPQHPEDDEGEDDDDEEEEEEEDPGDELDDYFGAGEAMMGEAEEVVEDDV